MDSMTLLDLVFGALMILIGVVFKNIYDRLKTNETSVNTVDEKLNETRLHMSENYISKKEFHRLMEVLFSRIDESHKGLEKNFNRLEKKIDKIEDSLSNKISKNDYTNFHNNNKDQ